MLSGSGKKTAWGRTAALALAVSFILPFIIASTGWARVLFEEDFSREEKVGRKIIGGPLIQTSNGRKGWRGNTAAEVGSDVLLYDIQSGRDFLPEKGAVEILIQRTREGGKVLHPHAGTVWETVLNLVHSDKTDALAIYFLNKDNHFPDTSSFVIWGRMNKTPFTSFVSRVYLGRIVPVGEVLHLAVTWGPSPEKDNRVYLNGKVIPSENLSEKLGDLPTYFSDLLWLKVGADSVNKKAWPTGMWPLFGTALLRMAIHDDPDAAFDLSGVGSIIKAVNDDTFKVAGISGKLTAGDTVTVSLETVLGGTATFDMGNVQGIPMTPVDNTGRYSGTYTIRPGDDFENGQIAGRFVSLDNVTAEPVMSASKWTIDTKPVVTFKIDRKDLPADSATKARIKLVAKDVNGNPVKGRHLKLTLATTDEYTGTVGAGDFGKDVGATVETRWKGDTDSWGEVEFDYTAGFSAKTVILTAKDLDSGGVTVDYITAFKEASIDIALTPPVSRAAARRGLTYILKVEASRTELTADGRSRSVIRATLLDPNGTPVAGDPVVFALSSPNGTLRTISGTTDSSGTATADYTAGKKIGIVVVTATATLRNATGNVSIILLSDAPAKIYLKARPETLPADGISRADLQVKVTDVNDNPNKDTKVEFRVAKGGGKVEYADRVTDRFGDAQNRYTAGNAPGIASVLATVRSKVPTESELSKARNVLFAPYNPEGDEIRIEKWLKKKGDTFTRGEPLVEYTVGRRGSVRQILALYDGTVGEVLVEYWDVAEVGQTLAILIPAPVSR